MRILLLGGTGAIGKHLSRILSDKGHEVYVTTRAEKSNHDAIHYLTGDAKNKEFLFGLSKSRYDRVVDFMIYNTHEFRARHEQLLSLANHYIFISTGRVFAKTQELLTEQSPRILDVTKDIEYLNSDEYALTKARQEDILLDAKSINWTIVRPYISYAENRLQFGAMEKEEWLHRAINLKTNIFCEEIASSYTTMTYADDVAYSIAEIVISGKDMNREAFNVASEYSCNWRDVEKIYSCSMNKLLGHSLKIKMVEIDEILNIHHNKYQVLYDRIYNRVFDNSKLKSIIGNRKFTRVTDGLPLCLEKFLKQQKFENINPIIEAKKDKITKEFTSLSAFVGIKNKLKYLAYRSSIKI